MTTNGFDIVDRPTEPPRSVAIAKALLETIENGKAVRVLMNGTTSQVLRNRYATSVKRSGFKLRSRVNGDGSMSFWCVKE